MPHGDDLHHPAFIIYDIDHAVVSNTDTPTMMMRPDEFTATRRAWVVSQRTESLNNSPSDTLI